VLPTGGNYNRMLPSGFEPESPARKAGMIGRTTLWEHESSPEQIRTADAGSKGQNVAATPQG
jgi:hypothetical protein